MWAISREPEAVKAPEYCVAVLVPPRAQSSLHEINSKDHTARQCCLKYLGQSFLMASQSSPVHVHQSSRRLWHAASPWYISTASAFLFSPWLTQVLWIVYIASPVRSGAPRDCDVLQAAATVCTSGKTTLDSQRIVICCCYGRECSLLPSVGSACMDVVPVAGSCASMPMTGTGFSRAMGTCMLAWSSTPSARTAGSGGKTILATSCPSFALLWRYMSASYLSTLLTPGCYFQS